MVYVIVGALVIGLTLGLLGSGGSILTVPVLVYLLHHTDKVAIAESLAIVGGIALFGAMGYARRGQIHWRSVVFFGIPGMAGALGGAWAAQFVPGAAQLTLFALVMLAASYRMARKPPVTAAASGEPRESTERAWWRPCIEGAAVGLLTGLVGVGGGFLIVPALVLLGGLEMKRAVGTSLMIIAMNAGTSFLKYLGVLDGLGLEVDWTTIGMFLGIGIFGSLAGQAIGRRVDQAALRRVFAVFLVVMGVVILIREAPRAFAGDQAGVQHELTGQGP